MAISGIGMLVGGLITTFAGPVAVQTNIAAGGLFGLMEPLLLVQLWDIFSTDYPDQIAQINGLHRFLCGVGIAFLFFVSPFVGFYPSLGIMLGTQVLSLLCFYVSVFIDVEKKVNN